MSARPESDFMRAARQFDFDAHQLPALDCLALCVGYVMLMVAVLVLAVGGAISLVDWAQGRPQTVLPQVQALLVWIDGGRP